MRCVHPTWKRDAIGARVEIRLATRKAVATIGGGSSFLSANPARAHFGLGPEEEVERIVVRWPDGLEETFPGVPANRRVTLGWGEGQG